jgi:hypothetical protein
MTTATIETTRDVRISIGEGPFFDAQVTVPVEPKGVVVFAHGSGSVKP